MKTFYLARYIDEDCDSPTHGKEVVRRVTAQGWSNRGLRIDRWMRVRANNMAEARAKFERGEGQRYS